MSNALEESVYCHGPSSLLEESCGWHCLVALRNLIKNHILRRLYTLTVGVMTMTPTRTFMCVAAVVVICVSGMCCLFGFYASCCPATVSKINLKFDYRKSTSSLGYFVPCLSHRILLGLLIIKTTLTAKTSTTPLPLSTCTSVHVAWYRNSATRTNIIWGMVACLVSSKESCLLRNQPPSHSNLLNERDYRQYSDRSCAEATPKTSGDIVTAIILGEGSAGLTDRQWRLNSHTSFASAA